MECMYFNYSATPRIEHHQSIKMTCGRPVLSVGWEHLRWAGRDAKIDLGPHLSIRIREKKVYIYAIDESYTRS